MKKQNAKILFIDDNEDVLLAAKLLLKPYFTTLHTENNPNLIPSLLEGNNYDVIFLDMNFTGDTTSGKEGFFWLKEILKIDPSAVVILITAFGDIDTAVKAVKEGATDFVLKPWQNEKLLATLSAAFNLRKSKKEVSNLRSQSKQISMDIDQKFHDLIGISPSMKTVFNTIEKVAKTDANVLILGENGTGKELVARALHRQSNRNNEVFISVDMGTITPSLFESEFFGHIKGAFTDAKENRIGRFEIASGGTLFLDEIGNIPIELQAKLLTALQNRVVTPVGLNKSKPFDIRLICATNMPIYQRITENKFRQDLLYRINTVEIQIPPLRERKEDIPILTDFFLETFKQKYNKQYLEIDKDTFTKLKNYYWPGNVRELQHTIERSVIMCEGDCIKPDDFFFPTTQTKKTEEHLSLDNYNLFEIEKTIIKKILHKNNGNITKTASELGLTRAALYRRMGKYGF